MDYKDILKIVNERFINFQVVEKPYNKYGVKKDSILIKRFIDRLDKYFIFAEITNLVIGTTTVESVWVINYKINDNDFNFELEPGKEIDLLEISLDWYIGALEVERQRSNYLTKYQEIKKNTTSEIREYKINQIINK